MGETMLQGRLRAAVGTRTYREVGGLTGTHHETVRRYLGGTPPSVEFLSGLCTALGISGEWRLPGRGPMRRVEVRGHALREATASDLVGAMAATLERTLDRVERLEVFVSTMETRLRARERDGAARGAAKRKRRRGSVHSRDEACPGSPDLPLSRRVGGVADAFPERTRPDAR